MTHWNQQLPTPNNENSWQHFTSWLQEDWLLCIQHDSLSKCIANLWLGDRDSEAWWCCHCERFPFQNGAGSTWFSASRAVWYYLRFGSVYLSEGSIQIPRGLRCRSGSVHFSMQNFCDYELTLSLPTTQWIRRLNLWWTCVLLTEYGEFVVSINFYHKKDNDILTYICYIFLMLANFVLA